MFVSLSLMHSYNCERICMKFDTWHPYIPSGWSWGLASAAQARGLALRVPGNSELASDRHQGS